MLLLASLSLECSSIRQGQLAAQSSMGGATAASSMPTRPSSSSRSESHLEGATDIPFVPNVASCSMFAFCSLLLSATEA